MTWTSTSTLPRCGWRCPSCAAAACSSRTTRFGQAKPPGRRRRMIFPRWACKSLTAWYMPRKIFTRFCFPCATALPSAASNSAERDLRTEEVADEEAKVRGPLGEAPHKVRKPIVSERNVNADAIAVADEPALEIGAHAVQQLEFEIILGNLLGSGVADGCCDHARIMGGDGVIKAAGQ